MPNSNCNNVIYIQLLFYLFLKNPIVTSIEPDLGPQSGGTMVTLYGHYLETGRDRNITICGKTCTIFVYVLVL